MNHNILLTKLAVYTLKNFDKKEVKDITIGYITKEKGMLVYHESLEVGDEVTRKKYINAIKKVVEELIKSDSVVLGWGKKAEKDGKIIYHEYERPCPIDDPNFLAALHKSLYLNRDELEKLIGQKISIGIVRE